MNPEKVENMIVSMKGIDDKDIIQNIYDCRYIYMYLLSSPTYKGYF